MRLLPLYHRLVLPVRRAGESEKQLRGVFTAAARMGRPCIVFMVGAGMGPACFARVAGLCGQAQRLGPTWGCSGNRV